MRVDIVLTKKTSLKGYTLVEGFPGIGLVGTIAAGYLVERRKMEPIGYLHSREFPPMATIHSGIPYFPARMYRDPKEKICVLFAEFIVPANLVNDLATSIVRFAKEQGISEIVSLAGMSTAVPTGKTYGIASSEKMSRRISEGGVELIKEGITTGVSGVLIATCAAEGFPAMSLLSEARQGYPDPRAAAELLKKFSEIAGVKVDTKALLEEASQVEDKMRKLLDQVKKVKDKYEKAEVEYPPMYG